MFKYVIKEKSYTKNGLVERDIIGANNLLYITLLYKELLNHQDRKIYPNSWFTVDQYENNKLIANDILF